MTCYIRNLITTILPAIIAQICAFSANIAAIDRLHCINLFPTVNILFTATLQLCIIPVHYRVIPRNILVPVQITLL